MNKKETIEEIISECNTGYIYDYEAVNEILEICNKPRKLSEEKFVRASKDKWNLIPDKAVVVDINALIDEGKDIWQEDNE